MRKPAGYPMKINKLGLPSSLGILNELVIKGNTKRLRLLLTLLSVSRAFEFISQPNLSSITSVSTGSNFFECELFNCVKELGWSIKQPYWDHPHLSTKAGPNGVATISCFHDLVLLSEASLKDLYILGGEDFKFYINEMKSLRINLYEQLMGIPPTKGLLRKLSIINDREGKCRIIAILDWWTQTALHPLHDSLFGLLRAVKPDCTFNQLSHRTLKKGPYYSLDLTAATDRFPVQAQVAVLSALVGSKEYAEAWGRAMVREPFWTPWESKFVKYEVGQPMGAYSS